jgi:hypothetical protein
MNGDEEESRFGDSGESRFGSSEEDDGGRKEDNSKKKKRLRQNWNSRRVKAKKLNDHQDKDDENGDEDDAREKKRLYQREYRKKLKAKMSVDPDFAAKERRKVRDRVRRNRAANSKKERVRIGPNNTNLPIEVSCKWLYLEDKNMLKVSMTKKLEEGTPEYEYLMNMMGDDELVVVFDNVMPQEEFRSLIKSSINHFKSSSEVLDQMRIFKKEEKGAGMNHVHYAEQTVKLTMTKSEFYQYMTSSKEQIEVIAEEKRYNSKDCVMVSSM